jgi:hypothetical protein
MKTHPSIESRQDKRAGYYQKVVSYKVGETNGMSVYRLKTNDTLVLYAQIGNKPRLSEVPYDYLELIQRQDTIVLDSKQKIFNKLKPEGKKRNIYNFNITK